MCRVLEVSRSGYYAWRKREPSERAKANAQLLAQIRQIHSESFETYGVPRIHAVLQSQEHFVSKKRVERIMRLHGIQGITPRRRRVKTTNSCHDFPIAANLLDRNFQADAPNQKWVSDISYVETDEGWLYVATVLDLFSRKAVGWAMDDTLETSLVTRALAMAIVQRQPPDGLLHHSDRGSQYASHAYQAVLKQHEMVPSMSRTGNCYDNAAMESFFGTLKSELIHRRRYRTKAEARNDIFRYLETFYNRRRLHSTLGYLSPDAYEQAYAQQVLAM
jgi:transposase InsO family protein